jgi:hypothetical protein
MFPLPHHFNRPLGLDAALGEDRLDAYFVHYAGIRTLLSDDDALKLIAHDLETWRNAAGRYVFPDNIAIVVDGGLGEHVAAEPAIRYAREVLYRGDNLAIVCGFPELFRHLAVPAVDDFRKIDGHIRFHARFTSGRPDDGSRKLLSGHQVHPVERAALLALGVQLPDAYRRPRLAVDADARRTLAGKLASADPERLVLLHPGRGAAPNTFPSDVWQSYADALNANGFRVAVIGKNLPTGRGVVPFDRSGCLDLVDKLSLEELIALVAQARVLVSNDSGPVQVAAAFDNWIGLIAAVRRPEYVLPWRSGSQAWRTRNLERRPLYDDYLHKPSGTRQPPLDACSIERLRECLPQPGEVVDFVQAAFGSS